MSCLFIANKKSALAKIVKGRGPRYWTDINYAYLPLFTEA